MWSFVSVGLPVVRISTTFSLRSAPPFLTLVLSSASPTILPVSIPRDFQGGVLLIRGNCLGWLPVCAQRENHIQIDDRRHRSIKSFPVICRQNATIKRADERSRTAELLIVSLWASASRLPNSFEIGDRRADSDLP